ncbi:LysR family transcriptional regulator [Vibrio orientalis CIP 102891 = ATCC 33934]|uniref:LysR family transcriptional regulator n=1 Tax=Vibrio orientalis CIP 102891 = ATCC 33934 TaxID=675816 RepID=C9QGF7_VIBOR|nr:LysR family transcriptional regulator [Vibrio orientalis]EEX94839.1 transcriptional regulator LysR family [Vibrio orientalis CIP 102891 = ATCC 33934]EGU53029.1 LysR family transcriptional regulator [Vibrio orientalis CIP 102891 = ATCC 33934]
MLNPIWLKTFVTLIDTGHFTKTADKLFMTQPGVSQHIKKLEQACGHALIKRYNKSFEITEAGKTVYDYANHLDTQQAQMLQSLNQDDPRSGTVSLSCSGSLALSLYPRLLDLQCKYPQLITYLEAAPHHKILAEIISGDMDLGIVTHEPSDPRVDSEQFGQEPLCLMMPKPLATKALDEDQLKKIGLIRHPDAEHYLSLYFSRCGEEELERVNIHKLPITGYVNQLNQILLPVAKGHGFTILPKSALDTFPLREQVAIYQPHKEVIETLYLLTKRHRQLPARFNTVKDVIREQLQR